MARSKKITADNAIETTLVSSCFIEEPESVEEALAEQRRVVSNSISLGNGGYIRCAAPLSDDL